MIKALIPLLCAAALPAQTYYQQNRPTPQDPVLEAERSRQQIRRQVQEQTFPYNLVPKGAPMPFHLGYRPGLKSMFPRYAGLPSYPSSVPGYGGYPTAGGEAEGMKTSAPPVRMADPNSEEWPSWVTVGLGKENRRSSARKAVLARESDPVFVREPAEQVFTPLTHHDKFRYLETGSRVQVPGQGSLQVIFHDGAAMRCAGELMMEVVELNERTLDLSVLRVDRMWLQPSTRMATLHLPDGTVARVDRAAVFVQRLGNRCVLTNNGPGTVNVAGKVMTGKLETGQYMSIWLQPETSPHHSVDLGLAGDVTSKREGKELLVQGGGGGHVVWCGARFKVGASQRLRITPLAGASFPLKGLSPAD